MPIKILDRIMVHVIFIFILNTTLCLLGAYKDRHQGKFIVLNKKDRFIIYKSMLNTMQPSYKYEEISIEHNYGKH